MPCPDARGRCDAAIKVACKKNGTIVLGVGLRPGDKELLFSEAMMKYLTSKGWPKEKIIVNPAGWSTVYETKAMYEAIKKAGDGKIIAVSAWYHIIRVWLIWAIVCKRFVGLRVSWRTYPWTNPFREFAAFPVTLYKLFKLAKIQNPGA